MAHFYGEVEGKRGPASRIGTEDSGLSTIAASWDGAVQVELWYDRETGQNHYRVKIIGWGGATPHNAGVIAEGIIGAHGEQYAEIL